ncbi:hypothetical protein [Candidatus Poriferisodalis sp.]|uniref:hypothetical protein n=1 Tax=Candidatus Poriferisodalis sp. TaxID=3101277 RepID=UPI003B524ED6
MFADLLYRSDTDGSEPAETIPEAAGWVSVWPDPATVWRFDGSYPDSHYGSADTADVADTAGSPDDAGAMAGSVAAQNGSQRDGSLRSGGRGAVAEPEPPVSCADTASAGFGVDGSEGLASLGYGDLKDLVVELAAERARVEGRYLTAVGELASRNGAQSAAYILCDQTRLNASQARTEARLAESLVVGGMTATLDALQAGEIGMSHAKVIAQEAPKKHRRSEAEFLELCRAYPSDTVARHLLAYQSQQVFRRRSRRQRCQSDRRRACSAACAALGVDEAGRRRHVASQRQVRLPCGTPGQHRFAGDGAIAAAPRREQRRRRWRPQHQR